jgi:2,5-dichloro-2,5-cyclohexadiene-1,4-diol dehydrogenase 1
LCGRARPIGADISDEQAVEQFVKGAVDVKGKLDGALNNARIVQRSSMLHELPLDEWNRVNSVNLAGTSLCVKHQIAAMLKTGGGSIVNTSSALGAVAVRRHGAYTASKHGVVGLTRTAAVEYSGKNIRVNGILPGSV